MHLEASVIFCYCFSPINFSFEHISRIRTKWELAISIGQFDSLSLFHVGYGKSSIAIALKRPFGSFIGQLAAYIKAVVRPLLIDVFFQRIKHCITICTLCNGYNPAAAVLCTDNIVFSNGYRGRIHITIRTIVLVQLSKRIIFSVFSLSSYHISSTFLVQRFGKLIDSCQSFSRTGF